MISRGNLFFQVVLILLSSQSFGQGSWVQVANCGVPCQSPKGGVINGKAYVTSNNDTWEYDPVADTWTQKANFPGAARFGPCSFVVNSILYSGTGNVSPGTLLKDWWKYDPSN